VEKLLSAGPEIMMHAYNFETHFRTRSVIDFEDEEFFTPGEEVTKADRIIQAARDWKPIDLHDDFRAPEAAKEGGFALDDPVVLTKFRNALKDLIG
jgi:hypothetical protein